MVNFDGDILIVDAEHLCVGGKRKEFHLINELYLSQLPTTVAADNEKIKSLKSEIIRKQASLSKEYVMDDNWRKLIESDIKTYSDMAENLLREENWISVPDVETPAINFMGGQGFTKCIWGDTLFKTGTLSIVNASDKNCLGKTQIHSGKFAVCYLREAIKYNPELDKFIKENPFLLTVIKNFNGVVSMEVVEPLLSYDLKNLTSKSIVLHGIGNINFVGKKSKF